MHEYFGSSDVSSSEEDVKLGFLKHTISIQPSFDIINDRILKKLSSSTYKYQNYLNHNRSSSEEDLILKMKKLSSLNYDGYCDSKYSTNGNSWTYPYKLIRYFNPPKVIDIGNDDDLLQCLICMSTKHHTYDCLICNKCASTDHETSKCTIKGKYSLCLRCNSITHSKEQCGVIKYNDRGDISQMICQDCFCLDHIRCIPIILLDSIYG